MGRNLEGNVCLICIVALFSLLLILKLPAYVHLSYAMSTSVSAEDTTLVYVDPLVCQAELASTFDVNVSVANVSGLYSYDFMLYYDTFCLDGVEVKLPKGHFLQPVNPTRFWIIKLDVEDDFNSTHGRVRVAVGLMYPETGKDGSGVLATITFRATRAGWCLLDLCEHEHPYRMMLVKIVDGPEEITFNVQDGYFKCDAPEHEVAVFLEAPAHLIPGEAANITVVLRNGGQNEESNVALQLIIDGKRVDSALASSMPLGSERTFSYNWLPPYETRYNVTAYAPDLTGETNTANNVASKVITVSYVIMVPEYFTTVQEAIQAASPGAIVHVTSGTYCEHLNVDKSLTITGENVDNTIIDGSGTWKIITINGERNKIRINGLTIRNGLVGVWVEAHSSIIEGNTISNCTYGIFVSSYMGGSIIRRNTIANNEYGVICDACSHDNVFYHNNLINNKYQAVDDGSNIWTYSDEGNYWSNYDGTDTDGNRIGDTPYNVNVTQCIRDVAPLLSEHSYLIGDLNDDAELNPSDLESAAVAFGSFPKHSQWNPIADTNCDGKVNMIDITLIARSLENCVGDSTGSLTTRFEFLVPWTALASIVILAAISTFLIRTARKKGRA